MTTKRREEQLTSNIKPITPRINRRILPLQLPPPQRQTPIHIWNFLPILRPVQIHPYQRLRQHCESMILNFGNGEIVARPNVLDAILFRRLLLQLKERRTEDNDMLAFGGEDMGARFFASLGPLGGAVVSGVEASECGTAGVTFCRDGCTVDNVVKHRADDVAVDMIKEGIVCISHIVGMNIGDGMDDLL